ncbi:DUF1254 domain-containing protein [Vibrio vulnificus]|uniref:DUF1254 domain-containing protein n=1 Tax=Vibrio vulnificus TaxID=672 RepID=UPI001A18A453|nr:DUF1254 domain-containing protein [Vibrio vulnificus]ELM6646706.1 DUF1254 domain-containing protein [Vibrio vulnificus]ELV8588991.1 DUF1254 domain-containing protein [Vibrio vulnificus]MCG6288393.1 DUF1254 domain-containing protein [Vibrio vulnificus]MCJ0822277.1 DUF1254 domain-containing protein [Vibrio vulnificus]HAS6210434.1 DUF1254 domain-containing protein [Vibrio vulnificus]
MKHTLAKWVTGALLVCSCSSYTTAFAADTSSATQTQMAQQISQALNTESYTLGVNAYLWGSTLVRLEQVSRQYTDLSSPQAPTSYRAPLNQFGHARQLPGPADTDMPTANQDTLYSSAILDLSQGPMVLSVPEVTDRYYVIDLFDMWHNLFKYVGTRATGSQAHQYLIVPPGWEKPQDLPYELIVVEAPTSKVWLWGRTQVFGEQDYPAVHAIQDQYTLTPLAVYQGKAKKVVTKPLAKRPGEDDDPLRFFVELGEYLKTNPVDERQQALLGQFAKIGLTKHGFNREQLSPQTQQMLAKAIKDGENIANAQVANPANVINKNGWNYAFVLEQFGDDNALRSMIAHPYLGGQGAIEALYPMAYTDAQGQPLTGSNDYTMHFEQEPPVGAFWSVTVYDAQSKMLVENDLHRYALNSQSSLQKNADGSFDLIFSQQKPDGAKQSNWLATPQGGFYVITRLYIPSKSILEMTWTVPAITQQSSNSSNR